MNLDNDLTRASALVRASESWAKQYEADPVTHAKLIAKEAKLGATVRKYLNNLSNQASSIVSWTAYSAQVKADYNVDVIINDKPLQDSEQEFIKLTFEEVAAVTYLGVQASESIYKIPTGISSTDELIQRLTTEQLASLVGKKVDKTGQIVDNPDADYRITTKTRNDIAQSIKISLNLGEKTPEAIERVRKTIKDPKRAQMIAETEAVNAFNQGVLGYGEKAGAKGKTWMNSGAIDVCKTYTQLGPVLLNFIYDKKRALLCPAAHPHCKCAIRLIFQQEWDRLIANGTIQLNT